MIFFNNAYIMSNYLKTGGSSVLLGSNLYNGFMPIKDGKLLKLTKITTSHNEFKHTSLIKKIVDYQNYYAIPDADLKILNPSDKFYRDLKDILHVDDLHILNGSLHYCYILYAGDKDLHDTLSDMKVYSTTGYWKNYKSIFNFSLQIMKAIMYLNNHKICHLDVKPENIMINTLKNEFKLIDFGFCSVEPFHDYTKKLRCTVGYFPANFKIHECEPWLPQICANDLKSTYSGNIPMKDNYMMVYKIDSYCFGRVLYYLKYMYEDNLEYSCFTREKSIKNKIEMIIDYLTLSNVYERYTVKECLNTIQPDIVQLV